MNRSESGIAIVVCLILSFFLLGCGLSPKTTGSLKISLNNNINARTLSPSINMDVASYSITGTGPEGATFATTSSGGDCTINDLLMGDWTIIVNALNNTGLLIGTGTSTVQVTAGDSSTTITVRPIEGTGSLALTIKWPSEQILVPAISATLTPAMGTPQTMDFTITGATATYAAPTLANGYYTFAFTLNDNGIAKAGAVDVVRIVTGQTTSGTYEFTDINQVGGGLKITLDPQMESPLVVTMSSILTSQIVGNTQHISATVSNYTGQLNYNWYVNGAFQATGQNYTFGSGLPMGHYRIDVVAQTANGLRAGCATATIQLVPGTGGAIIYDANGATGGSVPVDTNVYPEGMTVTVSGNTGYLVKSGYQIAGWITDPDPVTGKTTSYAPDSTFVMKTTDVTLHALWIPLSLTFSASGNDVTITGTGPTYPSEIIVPEGVTAIGESAFYLKAGITSVTLPNTTELIGGYAFRQCSNLESVLIPSVKYIGTDAFIWCSKLVNITLPDSVLEMDQGAFDGCSSLSSINIPMNLSLISDFLFADCSSLTSITIPTSIERIGNIAFQNCSSLTNVSIPSNVTSLGSSAFSGCSMLSSVTMESTIPLNLGNTMVFEGTANDLKIHVPADPSYVILAYQSATNWVYYADKIVAP